MTMHLSMLFRSHGTLQHETKSSRLSRQKGRSQLRISLAVRLAIGFLLAATFAAGTTGLIGIQHAEIPRKQSDFYKALSNTNLVDASLFLEAIQSQNKTVLDDVDLTEHPDMKSLSSDEKKLENFIEGYDGMLFTYAAKDLLSQQPDKNMLLGSDSFQMESDQQHAFVSAALYYWGIYYQLEMDILRDIQAAKFNDAVNENRLLSVSAYADTLSSLRSLTQLNEQIALLLDDEANSETQQLFISASVWALLAFLGVLSICLIISRTLVLRLQRLHQVTQAVERGQINTRIAPKGNDEISDVSNSVNMMLDALVEAIRQTTEAQQQLDLAYQQERQVNQMKDQFIRNISHEFRTPLTEIYGFLELLNEYKGKLDVDTQASFLQQALGGCEDLLALFSSFLDAANVGTVALSPKLEELSLHPVIKGILEQCDPRQRADHPVQLEVPSSLTVRADPQYLRQVLRNLLSNAFKYTPPKTSIVIRAAGVESAGGASREPSRVCICVKDSGPGIPPEEQGVLFQQFVRLTRDMSGNIRGTGLGLYLCRLFVEAMNGEIWVESSGIAGEGSTFFFTLPAKIET